MLPPFDVKLGLMKKFVKVMDKTKAALKYVKNKCPRVSKANGKKDEKWEEM